MSGSRAEDSGKSSDRLLRISKNDRVAGRQLQKKSGAGAEVFKKCSGGLLRIIKKTGPTPSPPNAIPTNIHQNIRRVLCGRPVFLRKSPVWVRRIVKKDRNRSWQLQKKSRSVAADCKKSSIRLLRIPENLLIGYCRFKKKIASRAEDCKKSSMRLLRFQKNV